MKYTPPPNHLCAILTIYSLFISCICIRFRGVDMITLSMDECGNFEYPDDNIIMCAGIAYQGDAAVEKARIRQYFQQQCLVAGVPYPSGLHNHGPMTAKVKKQYTQTLPDFLKKERKNDNGKYYVFACLKGNYHPFSIGGSDLYESMAIHTVIRTLCYSGKFKNETVSLDIASRVFSVSNIQGQIQRDAALEPYKRLGYGIKKTTNDRAYIQQDYREVFRREGVNVHSISVRSTDYASSVTDHEFLYLSDAVCSFLSYRNVYSGDYLGLTKQRMSMLPNSIFFLYDDVETAYMNAWKENDITLSLKGLYDAVSGASEVSKFYKHRWEHALLAELKERCNEQSLTTAIKSFKNELTNQNLNQKRQVYIFEHLEGFSDTVQLQNNILYLLYSNGIACYNHIGATDKANKCSHLAEKYKKSAEFSDKQLEELNRAVSKCDELKFREAMFITEDIIDILELVSDGTELGRAYSQLGQIYSFLNDKRAEEYFIKALRLIGDENNRYQTLSYLLHYYIQANEKEKYEEYAKAYFGSNSLEEQLEFILNENQHITLKYAFYIYIKALYIFYIHNIPKTVLNILKICENKIPEHELNGHPWEISYKYLAMVAYHYHFKQYKSFREKAVANQNEKILEAIRLMNLIDIKIMEGKNVRKDKEKLCNMIHELNGEDVNSPDDYMTYMYR